MANEEVSPIQDSGEAAADAMHQAGELMKRAAKRMTDIEQIQRLQVSQIKRLSQDIQKLKILVIHQGLAESDEETRELITAARKDVEEALEKRKRELEGDSASH